jgi:hypothetical protein
MRSDALTEEAKLLNPKPGHPGWSLASGRPASLTCPECAGPVAEIRDRVGVRYR